MFDALSTVSGFEKTKLSQAIRFSKATLDRRKDAGRFTAEESDRLYRFAKVLDAATELFEGDVDAASAWLQRAARGLGNRAPADMLRTSVEYQLVLDFIGRLEHGIPA